MISSIADISRLRGKLLKLKDLKTGKLIYWVVPKLISECGRSDIFYIQGVWERTKEEALGYKNIHFPFPMYFFWDNEKKQLINQTRSSTLVEDKCPLSRSL